MLNFRLFWISLGLLLVVGGVVALVDGLSPTRITTPAAPDSGTEAQAPFRPRFVDDCGNAYYPLDADRRTVFGSVREGQVTKGFYLVNAGRKEDSYTQEFRSGDMISPLPVHCVDGQVEMDSYVDWSGVLGAPLSVRPSSQSSGIRVPKDMKAGSRWNSEFVLDAKGLPEHKVFGASSVTVSLSSQAFIPETLMAPAGSFKVFRVAVHQKVSYLDASGAQVHEPIEEDYFEYWAKGRGLVRIHASRALDWDYVIVDSGYYTEE